LAGNAVKGAVHVVRGHTISHRTILTVGIIINLGVLGIFKYTDFFITNVNWITSTHLSLSHIVLPLAISFFTFQQIAYLVDCYRGQLPVGYTLRNYATFVTFFPHLIAGPILHHKEIVPQFEDKQKSLINYRNIALGLFLLFLGLVKKAGIADTFAVWANAGYASAGPLTFFDAWATSLSYTFQLYFDFSGYTDMALGSALLFNIVLPFNFNSPYKATNIQDFWERWHMSLTRWFREYLYLPLAWRLRSYGRLGSYLTLFTVFTLIGLWHGGAWTFIALGVVHAIAMTTHRFWKESVKISIPAPIGWLLTFIFVNSAWILFRSTSITQALSLYASMLGLHGLGKQTLLFAAHERYVVAKTHLPLPDLFAREVVIWILIFLFVVLVFENSNVLKKRFSTTFFYGGVTLLLYAFGTMSLSGFSEFLYFNF
jgi:D-alanyl-lipoteichoic acid acyltransferase DltB (MBOAT superfamily)